MPPPPGWIVILNGPPRSGKSAIVEAIQDSFEGIWGNLGVDVFSRCVTPARYRPGIGLRPGGELPAVEAVVPVLYAGLYESVAAHSRLGLNVAVDVGHHDAYSRPLQMLPGAWLGSQCSSWVSTARSRSSWSDGTPASPAGKSDTTRAGQTDRSPNRCSDGKRRSTCPALRPGGRHLGAHPRRVCPGDQHPAAHQPSTIGLPKTGRSLMSIVPAARRAIVHRTSR